MPAYTAYRKGSWNYGAHTQTNHSANTKGNFGRKLHQMRKNGLILKPNKKGLQWRPYQDDGSKVSKTMKMLFSSGGGGQGRLSGKERPEKVV